MVGIFIKRSESLGQDSLALLLTVTFFNEPPCCLTLLRDTAKSHYPLYRGRKDRDLVWLSLSEISISNLDVQHFYKAIGICQYQYLAYTNDAEFTHRHTLCLTTFYRYPISHCFFTIPT